MSVNMGQAVGYLDLDTSKFKSGFKSALNDLKVFQSETATSKDKLAAFSSAATSAGRSLTKGLTVPIAGMGAAAVAVTARFDAGMSKVQAISGATSGEMEKLRAKAKEMGAQTKFSASESAEAFNYMAMAGWKTEDMLDGIEGVMNLAAASGEDLATTSDIVTDALTAFGLSAKDSTHFADVLAAASSNANTNVGMMGETFKYVAPVAGALGFSVEDVSTAIGLMANSGIKGSQAGTALRNIFTRLVKPTGESAKVMEQLGISVTDSSGQMKDFNTIMGDLRKGFAGLSEAEKAQAASALAGQYGMSGLLAIVNTSEKDFGKLTNAIYNADGASAQMAETMMDNLPGAITLFKSALEGLGIRVGEVMTPTIVSIVRAFSKFVSWLTNASDGTVKFAVAMGTVLASLGPVLLIIGTMTRQVLTLVEAYQALNKILAGKTIASILKSAAAKIKDVIATNLDAAANMRYQASLRAGPITTMISKVLALAAAHKVAAGAALGVVGAAIGLAIYMKKTGSSFEDVKNKALGMFNSFKEQLPQIMSTVASVASSIVQQVPSMISSLIASLGAIAGPIASAIGGVVSQLPSMLSGVFSQVGSLVVSGLSKLKEVLPQVAQWWANDMPQLIAVGSDMIVNVINGISDTLPELIDTGTEILVQFIDQFFAQVPKLVNVGVKLITNLVQGLVAALPRAIQKIVKAIPKVLNQIISALSKSIGPLLQAAIQILTSIINTLIANLPMIIDAVVTIISALVSAIASNAPAIISAALKLALALATGLLKAMPQIIVAAVKIALALVKAFLSIVGALVKAGVTILQALWKGISSWATTLANKVKQVGVRVLRSIIAGLGNLIAKGKDWIVSLWKGISASLSSVVRKVRSAGKRIVSAIKGALSSLASKGREWIQTLWNGINGVIGGIIKKAGSKARKIVSAVKKGLTSLYSAGSDFIQGLWNGMKSKLNSAINWAKNKVKALPKAVKKVLGIGSPSWIMREYGEFFMEGLQIGMEKGFLPVMAAVERQMATLTKAYNPLQDYDFGIGESMDQKMLGAIQDINVGVGGISSGEGTVINQNITIDGAENPSEVAEDLARELKIAMRRV